MSKETELIAAFVERVAIVHHVQPPGLFGSCACGWQADTGQTVDVVNQLVRHVAERTALVVASSIDREVPGLLFAPGVLDVMLGRERFDGV